MSNFYMLRITCLAYFTMLEAPWIVSVATPLWPSVGVKPNTWKSWRLGVFRDSRMFRADSKGQNTSHWGVLGVIGKFLKRRYRNCPRIGDLDMCSLSYGQKKGWESHWQFDSWPLKVGNRPLPDVQFERATWRWKDLDEGYNFGSDRVAIQLCSRELWRFKVPGVPPGTISGLHFGSPGNLCHSDVASATSRREYYMGKVVASPESGPWWVSCVQVPVASPNTKGCPEC